MHTKSIYHTILWTPTLKYCNEPWISTIDVDLWSKNTFNTGNIYSPWLHEINKLSHLGLLWHNNLLTVNISKFTITVKNSKSNFTVRHLCISGQWLRVSATHSLPVLVRYSFIPLKCSWCNNVGDAIDAPHDITKIFNDLILKFQQPWMK